MASIGQIGTPAAQGPLRWFVWACKWWWSKRSLIWGTILLNILLGVLVTWLFTDPSSLTKLPIGGILRNPYPFLIGFIVLLSLTVISGVGNLVQATPSQRKLLHRYLQRMIRDNVNLMPKGVPDLEAVPLDEVFIPLQFKPGKSPSDKMITEQEHRWHLDYLERYRHLLSQETPNELEQVLSQAHQEYERIFAGRDRVDFTYLWQSCTRKEPAAVIQGYPGMGKSTLIQHLTLYMARCGLKLPYPQMAKSNNIHPTLIPVRIPLKEFADAHGQNTSLSLEAFLTNYLKKLGIPGVDSPILEALKSGRCLIMLDGLDEVNDPLIRKQVQEEIRTFVAANADVSPSSFNRFLITSRVAGYDKGAFSDYLHYLIAELDSEQIKNFLPGWFRASVRNPNQRPEEKEAIAKKATLLTSKLRHAIKDNQGVRDMAENPLLLTLLAAMRQIKDILPDRRIELYIAVTKTLLEDSNKAKQLAPIDVNQAIQYLSPLAFTMQEAGNSFARQREVLASLQRTIGNSGKSPDEAAKEAQEFLARIRERSGLFVQRTGDYFGFMHRTFQEYFAAHFLLNAIQRNRQQGIEDLVSRARQLGDLWREPFLFAVAYQGESDSKIIDGIIRSLLDNARSPSQEGPEHDLLLAAECIIEAPQSINNVLQQDIALRLLQSYEQAQSKRRFNTCEQIENMIRRWLLSLPKETNRFPLPIVLRDIIVDTTNVPLQRATLTLLTLIAQQLADCPPNVFITLIPPLLALAGLPAVGNYRPAQGIAASANLDIADLALTVLSFLGKSGPSGSLLADALQYFKDNPERLRLLARYSLECGTLITPVVAPLSEENYRRYKEAIGQWIGLRDSQKTARVPEQAINTCLNIHQSLLDCAEEVMYPTTTLLLALMEQSAVHPQQPWQEIWKNYLGRELYTKSYIGYQQACLLWITLFIDIADQQHFAHLLLDHYHSTQKLLYRYALRFFTNLVEDLRYLGELRFPRELREIRSLRYLRYLRDFRDLSDLSYIREFRFSKTCNYPGTLRLPQKREEEDDQRAWPVKPTREEVLVCAKWTNSRECD